MPRRWSPNTRIWAYRYLVVRDGEKCSCCRHTATTQNPLDIDHIDGNPKNNDPSNLRLLCRRCNVKEANRLAAGDRSVCVCVCDKVQSEGQPNTRIAKTEFNYQDGSPEMRANQFYETSFRTWVLEQCKTGILKNEAINEGAELFGCSPSTTKRYLAKLTSRSGPIVEGRDALGHITLTLKPEYDIQSLTAAETIPRDTLGRFTGNKGNGYNGHDQEKALENTIKQG